MFCLAVGGFFKCLFVKRLFFGGGMGFLALFGKIASSEDPKRNMIDLIVFDVDKRSRVPLLFTSRTQ